MDTCTFQGNREELLIAYLYDAVDSGDRASFDAHLAGCEACRRELEELGLVRTQLAAWAPPDRPPVVDRGARQSTNCPRGRKSPRQWCSSVLRPALQIST